mgnify:CR=1 FL=1
MKNLKAKVQIGGSKATPTKAKFGSRNDATALRLGLSQRFIDTCLAGLRYFAGHRMFLVGLAT